MGDLISNWIYDHKQYFNETTWIMMAFVMLIGVRLFFDRPKNPADSFWMKSIALSVMGVALFFPIKSWGVWLVTAIFGLNLCAYAISRLSFAPKRAVCVVGLVCVATAAAGLLSGYIPSISTGPSMWPAASKTPSISLLNVRAFSEKTPSYNDDIDFEVNTTKAAWPTGRFRKRVWGVPGDTVYIEGNTVSINGTQVADCTPNKDTVYIQTRAPLVWWCHAKFPNGSTRKFVWGEIAVIAFDTTKVVVKKNQLFVMGDNTVESGDSRDYGAITSSWVHGRYDNPMPSKAAWEAW